MAGVIYFFLITIRPVQFIEIPRIATLCNEMHQVGVYLKNNLNPHILQFASHGNNCFRTVKMGEPFPHTGYEWDQIRESFLGHLNNAIGKTCFLTRIDALPWSICCESSQG